MKKYTLAFSILVGLGDALTGMLLIAVPSLTLKLMGIARVPEEPVFLQFVGAFVFSVGTAYLVGTLLSLKNSRWSDLKTTWILTAWVRINIFLFLAVAIMAGHLELTWASVPLYDLNIAMIQLAWIYIGKFPQDD